MHIWKDICMQYIHCTAMLHKIQIHRCEGKAYYSTNAGNELTLDDRLFGHKVVQNNYSKTQ